MTIPKEPPTLEEFDNFLKLLKTHDWYYSYADDHRVYKAGERAWHTIHDISITHPAFKHALAAWSTCMFKSDHLSQNEAKEIRDKTLAVIRQQFLPPAGE